jgi:hypothetical protein
MSDSDDDLPITELIKKRKRMEAAKAAPPVVKKVQTEKPKATEKTASVSSRTTSSSSTGNKAADFYTTTTKGQLVQSFLVRWWYAMEWPLPEDIGEAPPGYETLDGFPGVYISTRVRRYFLRLMRIFTMHVSFLNTRHVCV